MVWWDLPASRESYKAVPDLGFAEYGFAGLILGVLVWCIWHHNKTMRTIGDGCHTFQEKSQANMQAWVDQKGVESKERLVDHRAWVDRINTAHIEASKEQTQAMIGVVKEAGKLGEAAVQLKQYVETRQR